MKKQEINKMYKYFKDHGKYNSSPRSLGILLRSEDPEMSISESRHRAEIFLDEVNPEHLKRSKDFEFWKFVTDLSDSLYNTMAPLELQIKENYK